MPYAPKWGQQEREEERERNICMVVFNFMCFVE
jgi:hypothetical protein